MFLTFAKPKQTDYDNFIKKRIVQLMILHDVAQELILACKSLLKTFDKGLTSLKNTFDESSICLKLFSEVIILTELEYSEFLLSTSSLFNAIGMAQQNFQIDVEAQVIGPFQAWILTDFVRIKKEIEILHVRKHACDTQKSFLLSQNISLKHQLKSAQSKLALHRQKDVVKLELSKLPQMKINHEEIFRNFLCLFGAYHKSICNIIEKHGIDKWNIQLNVSFTEPED